MPASRSIPGHSTQAPTTSTVDVRREALLIEMLLSGLDLRSNAAEIRSPMLTYLVELLVMRTREELHTIGAMSRRELELSEATT